MSYAVWNALRWHSVNTKFRENRSVVSIIEGRARGLHGDLISQLSSKESRLINIFSVIPRDTWHLSRKGNGEKVSG